MSIYKQGDPRAIFRQPLANPTPFARTWSIRLPYDGSSNVIPANSMMATDNPISGHVNGPGRVTRAEYYLPLGTAYHFHIDNRAATNIQDTTQLGRGITGDKQYGLAFRSRFEVMLENMTGTNLDGYVMVIGEFTDQFEV